WCSRLKNWNVRAIEAKRIVGPDVGPIFRRARISGYCRSNRRNGLRFGLNGSNVMRGLKVHPVIVKTNGHRNQNRDKNQIQNQETSHHAFNRSFLLALEGGRKLSDSREAFS